MNENLLFIEPVPSTLPVERARRGEFELLLKVSHELVQVHTDVVDAFVVAHDQIDGHGVDIEPKVSLRHMAHALRQVRVTL